MPGPDPAPALLALALGLSLLAPCAAAQERPDALKLYLDGKYEEARVACLDEIAAAPPGTQSVEPYVVISWSLLALERYADAENYALKGYAIRKDPRLSEALGEAAFHLGRNEAALRNFQNYVGSVAEGGRVGAAYYYMGEIYVRLGRYGHADIAFSAAIQYSPSNARWWARAGWAREKGGDAAHALEAYRAALALDPRLLDALNGIERLSRGGR